MKATVLPTLLHAGEIHTADISSDGRFALTGGADSLVNIWDYAELCNFSPSSELVLAPKTTHKFDSTVSVARFCPKDPLVLAVGTIQGSVFLVANNLLECIFPLHKWNTSQSSVASNSETKPNADTDEKKENVRDQTPDVNEKANDKDKEEPQKPIHPSISTPNILDIAWSPDGRLLAWISACEVHLHDRKRQTYQTLIGTKLNSAPKSIAFDPTSNYFVCLGDDTVIDIFRYHYKLEMYQFKHFITVSRMANAVSNIVDYRRISWSPDGEYVSIPTASKGQSSLVSLISRSDNWSTKASLVGHDTCCEVVRFNPSFYSLQEAPPAASIPHLITPQMPENEIQDSSDPQRLHFVYNVVATGGSDMTLSIWNTIKEKPILVLKDIAKKPISDLCWHPTGINLLQASMDGHIAIYQFEEKELGNATDESIKKQLMGYSERLVKPFDYSPPVEGTTKKPPPVIIDQKAAIKKTDEPVNGAPTVDSTQVEPMNEIKKEDAIPEEHDLKPVVLEPSTTNIAEQVNKQAPPITKKPKPTAKGTAKPQRQKVTTKDGKKRIQPVLISETNGSASTPLQSNGHDMWTNSNSPALPMEYEKPSYAVTDSVTRKRPRSDDVQKKKRDLEPIKFIGSSLQNPNTAFSAIRLAIPKVRLFFQIEHSPTVFLDIRNGSGNENTPTRITYLRNEKQLWTDFIPKYVLLAGKGAKFWAVATADGEIYTYLLESGMRILPPIVLGSPVSFLETHGPYLLVITSVGELFVWDLEKKKIVLTTPQSIRALLDLNSKYAEDGLSKSDNITLCSVTSSGVPLITLSNGSGYLFNKDLGVWHIVTESWWAFGSHYWDSLTYNKGVSSKQEESIIAVLELKTNEEILRKTRKGRGKFMNKISKNMIMKEGFENLENAISINHLENRMLVSELLEEKHDFHEFFLTYVRRISELGLTARLLGICSELYGPEDSNQLNWEQKLCGFDKRELLKELVLTCAKYRDVQRILVHFAEKLGIVSEAHI